MVAYNKEIDKNQSRKTRRKDLRRWIASVIEMQGENGRHLELCFDGKRPIGFLYGKIDRPEHKGDIRPGWGYIMEFYVIPKYRRKGYGKEMFRHLENLLRADGAENMYLTADPVTGKPFWKAMGFTDSGIQSSENNLNIYEKKIPPFCFDTIRNEVS